MQVSVCSLDLDLAAARKLHSLSLRQRMFSIRSSPAHLEHRSPFLPLFDPFRLLVIYFAPFSSLFFLSTLSHPGLHFRRRWCCNAAILRFIVHASAVCRQAFSHTSLQLSLQISLYHPGRYLSLHLWLMVTFASLPLPPMQFPYYIPQIRVCDANCRLHMDKCMLRMHVIA